MQDRKPAFQSGAADKQATLPVAGEVFLLRKLLPQTADYDFNVHVMDFLPGEFLNVKVRCQLWPREGYETWLPRLHVTEHVHCRVLRAARQSLAVGQLPL